MINNKNKNKSKKVNTPIVISIVAAVSLGGVITVLSMLTFGTKPITVATRDITPYSGLMTETDFTTIEISKRDVKLFSNFVVDKTSLINKVATTDIVAGQPVKLSQFIDPANAEEVQNIVSAGKEKKKKGKKPSISCFSGDLVSCLEFFKSPQIFKGLCRFSTSLAGTSSGLWGCGCHHLRG